jgi:hypothetical protein
MARGSVELKVLVAEVWLGRVTASWLGVQRDALSERWLEGLLGWESVQEKVRWLGALKAAAWVVKMEVGLVVWLDGLVAERAPVMGQTKV